MSIELRITVEGLCECGIPHQTGRYEPGCRHDIECDWGTFGDPPLVVMDYLTHTTTIENTAALILVSKTFADHGGLPTDLCQAETTFYEDDGRLFMRVTADNGAWTWELFDAHWEDGAVSNVYIGRWPD